MGVHQSPEVYQKVKELLDIPIDEPIFIIRAQDQFSIDIIGEYTGLVIARSEIGAKGLGEWVENVSLIGQNFINWQRENRDKVKVPD